MDIVLTPSDDDIEQRFAHLEHSLQKTEHTIRFTWLVGIIFGVTAVAFMGMAL